ncbi:hypothetical protein CDAR_288251 [Caerostris darwini]|uniref:Uncharacterized protein n=1 Tax=Caerostris darwini TaxID=1538125 RepID=A0AAV4W9R7_9ARAC|nr:hypothetical protein CDAR_288251 [Caerostris darwini]
MNEIDVIGHLIHPLQQTPEQTSPSRQKRRLELYDESILEKECNMNEIDDIGHLIHPPPTNSETNISFKTEKKIRTFTLTQLFKKFFLFFFYLRGSGDEHLFRDRVSRLLIRRRAPPPHAPSPGVRGGGGDVPSGGEPAAHQPPCGRARGRRAGGGRPRPAHQPPMLADVGGAGFPGRRLHVGDLQTLARIPGAG